jgi:hypothetical protein
MVICARVCIPVAYCASDINRYPCYRARKINWERVGLMLNGGRVQTAVSTKLYVSCH